MRSNIIGIIGAMDIEVDSIIASMKRKKIKVISSIKFVSGKIRGKKVVVAKCGIGKVFAGGIEEYSPNEANRHTKVVLSLR